MTASQKILIKKLLTCHFLRKLTRKRRTWYVLYDAKINPVMKVRERTVDSLDKYIDPDIKIWKQNKHGDISFNLAMIRRLHGRHTMKKLYKQKHTLDAVGPLYKRKNKAIKKNEANEKVYYLF